LTPLLLLTVSIGSKMRASLVEEVLQGTGYNEISDILQLSIIELHMLKIKQIYRKQKMVRRRNPAGMVRVPAMSKLQFSRTRSSDLIKQGDFLMRFMYLGPGSKQ
jgi:hypothetical protein